MDYVKIENKANPMKKRSVHLVHEHFEEGFIVPLIQIISEGKRSYLPSHNSGEMLTYYLFG